MLTFQLVRFIPTLPLGTRSLPSAEREKVEGATSSGRNIWFGEDTDQVSYPSVQELSLSLGVGMTPTELFQALDDLQSCFKLTRLMIWAPHLGLGDDQRVVAVQALSGAVIHMSLLTHLSLPENIVTEGLLLHLSLLPRLETFKIYPTLSTNSLSGEVSYGFVSLRSLDVPNQKILQWFISYPMLDLEILKVRGLGRGSLPKIARKFSGLRQIYIEGASFGSPEIFVLGACFQLEEIEILTQRPLEMDDLDLDQFRTMFRNLRSLSIATRDDLDGIGFHGTDQ